MSSKAVAFVHQAGGAQTTLGYNPESDTTPTLGANQTVAVAFKTDQEPEAHGDLCPTLQQPSPSGGGQQHAVLTPAMQVRRLSVRECERLQGFPDGWTNVPYRGKPAADGPRYKALGNSMACNVMQWLGERIAMVDELMEAGPLGAATWESGEASLAGSIPAQRAGFDSQSRRSIAISTGNGWWDESEVAAVHRAEQTRASTASTLVIEPTPTASDEAGVTVK